MEHPPDILEDLICRELLACVYPHGIPWRSLANSENFTELLEALRSVGDGDSLNGWGEKLQNIQNIEDSEAAVKYAQQLLVLFKYLLDVNGGLIRLGPSIRCKWDLYAFFLNDGTVWDLDPPADPSGATGPAGPTEAADQRPLVTYTTVLNNTLVAAKARSPRLTRDLITIFESMPMQLVLEARASERASSVVTESGLEPGSETRTWVVVDLFRALGRKVDYAARFLVFPALFSDAIHQLVDAAAVGALGLAQAVRGAAAWQTRVD